MAATFLLESERMRNYAIKMIMRTPLLGKLEVVIRRATRNKKQNALLHAALSDIAEQLYWPPPPANDGRLQDIETWKRRATLSWLIEEGKQGEVILPLEEDEIKERFGILVPHTSDLDADEMASLVEWVFAFGAGNGVKFKDPKREEPPPPNPEDYR